MSENEILANIRFDGQREMGLMYVKYRAEFLHWVAREYGCGLEDCKDIYQFAILIFYENVKSGKLSHLGSSIKTYLFAVGKNVARDHLRRISRDAVRQKKWSGEHSYEEQDDQPNESSFRAAEKALARLGEPARKIIELYYYEKKSMEEISAMLNYKNSDTAKNQKCKAMAGLRKLFEEEIAKCPGHGSAEAVIMHEDDRCGPHS